MKILLVRRFQFQLAGATPGVKSADYHVATLLELQREVELIQFYTFYDHRLKFSC